MRQILIQFLVLIFACSQSFGQTSKQQLLPPFSESFYKEFTNNAIIQFATKYKTIQTVEEFAIQFLSLSSPEEKSFITQKLRQLDRFPKLNLNANKLEFSFDGKVVFVEIVNIFAGQMRINGKLWTPKNKSSVRENYESLLKIFDPKESVFINLLIPKAHAMPQALFVAMAAALVMAIPAATISIGFGLGCLASGAMFSDSSEEAWESIRKECPDAVKAPWLMYWEAMKAMAKGAKNIIGLNQKERGKSEAGRSSNPVTQ